MHLSASGKIGFILPVLTGCLTVTSLFSAYAYRLSWNQLPASLVIGAIVGLLAWTTFYALPLTRSASSTVAGIITLVVMTWMVYPYPIMPMMIMVSTVIVLYDLKPSQLKVITSTALIITTLAIVASLGQATYNKTTYASSSPQTATILTRTPDIYFIVPDRFTSPSALDECGLDTSDFVSELENRGFYVPYDSLSSDPAKPDSDSFAPTTRTLRFLASALNMGTAVDLNISYNQASSMVKGHTVGKILRSNGYIYHHIGDWWQETLSNPEADHNYIYKGYSAVDYLSQNELATAVVDRSWIRDANIGSLLPTDLLIRTNHERNKYQLATFEEIAGNGEHPKFVFVHILLPHPPYTWSKEGNTLPVSAGINTMERYLEQVQFTEGYLLQMIDSIEDSDSIIIIQSDEGIALSTVEANEELTNNQWNGVLSAWRIPGVDTTRLTDVLPTEILGYAIGNLKTGG